jgi:VanZ like family
VACWWKSNSPYSGGTVPDLHRVPSPGSLCAAEPIIVAVMRGAVWRWSAVVLWAGLIFGLSSIPSLGTGLGGWDLVLRKLGHATEYAILAVLLLRATGSARLAVSLAGGYAITDEVHQTLVSGRHGTPLDVAIDTVGAALGVLVWRALPRWRTA